MSFERKKAFEKVKQVFTEVFSISETEISEETSIANTPAWDSLEHINLIMALETEFQIKLEMGEIMELQSIHKILDILQEKVP